MKHYALLIFIAIFCHSSMAQQDTIREPKIDLSYTNKGFQLRTTDNKFLLHLESRLQFRFATPGDQNPLTLDDLESEKTGF